MARTDINYNNSNKTRYKVNNDILRVMNQNPALGIGYTLGSMLGENYFAKKRAKSQNNADKKGRGEDGSIGADSNGTYGVENTPKEAMNEAGTTARANKEPGYYESMNKAFNDYMNNNNAMYSGRLPKTPAQSNQAGITVGNVGNGGGVQTPARSWQGLTNASTYNPGSTGMYTNGARNLGNVIGADANGVYGVGNAAPSAANIPRKPANPPTYTDDQLRQIMGQNFTPEELSRMTTANERARMNAMMAPPVQAAATPAAVPQPVSAEQPASAPAVEVPDPSEAYPMATEGGSGLTPAQIGILGQIAAAATAEEEGSIPAASQAPQQSDLSERYRRNIASMFGSAPNTSSYSINLERLLTPSNSPYYSQAEIDEAYSRPLFAKK